MPAGCATQKPWWFVLHGAPPASRHPLFDAKALVEFRGMAQSRQSVL
jgi:hypothetical protein